MLCSPLAVICLAVVLEVYRLVNVREVTLKPDEVRQGFEVVAGIALERAVVIDVRRHIVQDGEAAVIDAVADDIVRDRSASIFTVDAMLGQYVHSVMAERAEEILPALTVHGFESRVSLDAIDPGFNFGWFPLRTEHRSQLRDESRWCRGSAVSDMPSNDPPVAVNALLWNQVVTHTKRIVERRLQSTASKCTSGERCSGSQEVIH